MERRSSRSRRQGIAALALATAAIGLGVVNHPATASSTSVQIQAFPVDGTCSYVDTWMAPRAGVDKDGNPNVHEGVDVIAASGVPLRAVVDGQITKLSTSTRGGNQLYLTMPDRTYFFYGHISSYAPGIALGTRVKAGDVIAYVGQTGDAVYSVPHLHFEVHPAANAFAPVNPFPIIRELSGCGRTGTRTSGTTTVTTATGTATTSPAVSTTAATASTSKPTASTVPATTTSTAFPIVPTTNSYSAAKQTNGFDGFVALAPSRVADSRVRFYMTRFTAGTLNYLTVAGRGSVPANATSALMNLTVTGSAQAGWALVWPCGKTEPFTSNINFAAGETVSNTALVGIGTSGRVCFRATAGVDVVVDVVGWQGVGGSDGFVPTGPTRLFDSRTDNGAPIEAAGVRRIQIPAANGGSITVTADAPSANGEIAAWACASSRPTIPALQISKGATSANSVVVPFSGSELCISPSVATHVIVDLTGTWHPKTGARPTPIAPTRLLDTRLGKNVVVEPFAITKVKVGGVATVPAAATAAQVNITVTGPREAGFITAWPCGTDLPNASVLNYAKGETVANATIVGLGGGELCLASSARTHIIVDANAYLA